MNSIKVNAFIEIAEKGYSAYMDDSPLDYGCTGEGATVEETIADFKNCYNEMKTYCTEEGKPFTEAEFEFCYDTANFLPCREYNEIPASKNKTVSEYFSGFLEPEV